MVPAVEKRRLWGAAITLFLLSVVMPSECFLSPAKTTTIASNQRVGSLVLAASSMPTDEIIASLRSAKNQHEIAGIVVKNVKVVAQPTFFLRVAEIADGQGEEIRMELDRLSLQVTAALEDIMKAAERSMDESSLLLQGIISACAEVDGEFKVPLSDERLLGLRTAVKANIVDCKDGFLTTAQAWLRKSETDGLEGMVVIIQKVLQVWAAEAIIRDLPAPPNSSPSFSFLLTLLGTDCGIWQSMVRDELRRPDSAVTREGLINAAQTAIEAVVLQHSNGSMMQRIQAEFVRELCSDIEAAAS